MYSFEKYPVPPRSSIPTARTGRYLFFGLSENLTLNPLSKY